MARRPKKNKREHENNINKEFDRSCDVSPLCSGCVRTSDKGRGGIADRRIVIAYVFAGAASWPLFGTFFECMTRCQGEAAETRRSRRRVLLFASALSLSRLGSGRGKDAPARFWNEESPRWSHYGHLWTTTVGRGPGTGHWRSLRLSAVPQIAAYRVSMPLEQPTTGKTTESIVVSWNRWPEWRRLATVAPLTNDKKTKRHHSHHNTGEQRGNHDGGRIR